LAKARELRGEFRAAADAYFNAAALYASPDADREALRAREWGAVNLAKAGLLDDARATYQWLAANAKDPAIRDSAARALKNL
jgi:transcriptional regulator GlxA family with amidase domain